MEKLQDCSKQEQKMLLAIANDMVSARAAIDKPITQGQAIDKLMFLLDKYKVKVNYARNQKLARKSTS